MNLYVTLVSTKSKVSDPPQSMLYKAYSCYSSLIVVQNWTQTVEMQGKCEQQFLCAFDIEMIWIKPGCLQLPYIESYIKENTFLKQSELILNQFCAFNIQSKCLKSIFSFSFLSYMFRIHYVTWRQPGEFPLNVVCADQGMPTNSEFLF